MLIIITGSPDVTYTHFLFRIYFFNPLIQPELNNQFSQLEESNGKGKDPTDTYIVFIQPPSWIGIITYPLPDHNRETAHLAPGTTAANHTQGSNLFLSHQLKLNIELARI